MGFVPGIGKGARFPILTDSVMGGGVTQKKKGGRDSFHQSRSTGGEWRCGRGKMGSGHCGHSDEIRSKRA